MLKNEFKLASLIKKGFTRHKDLNPQIFDENKKLRKEVRSKLLVIANDFIDSLNIDHIDSEDILLVGSIANYNWNPYSDVDIHITYDFNDIDADYDLVSEFFLAKKSEWNQEHNVKIYGYDVELYGQDVKSENVSGGIYSVLKDEWISEPQPEDYEISEESLINKTKHFMRLIDDVLDLDTSDETKIDKLKSIKDKIKKYRQSGLEEGGEYSEENLVFKMLRRTGYMEKLSDGKHELEDKVMSLPEGLNLPKANLNTPEGWFKNLLSQMDQVTTDIYVYFKLNNENYMRYNKENRVLLYSYDKIYLVLKEKFELSYQQMNELIKGIVEANTNLVYVTPDMLLAM